MNDKKPVVICNWKMKLNLTESVELAKAVKGLPVNHAEVVVCPSFTALSEVAKIFKHSKIKLGAQDCFWEASGSYTGEVSAVALKEAGCDFVILGHSERRQYLGETDEMVHRKVQMALDAGLVPVVCVGETFDQRQEGSKDYALIQQVTKALEGIRLGSDQRLVVAYEPVWVIGSGHAIEPPEVSSSQRVISQTLFDLFEPEVVSNNLLVIYGGSVDSVNSAKLLHIDHNQGFLVGGASLDINEFATIVKNI